MICIGTMLVALHVRAKLRTDLSGRSVSADNISQIRYWISLTRRHRRMALSVIVEYCGGGWQRVNEILRPITLRRLMDPVREHDFLSGCIRKYANSHCRLH